MGSVEAGLKRGSTESGLNRGSAESGLNRGLVESGLGCRGLVAENRNPLRGDKYGSAFRISASKIRGRMPVCDDDDDDDDVPGEVPPEQRKEHSAA